MPEEIEHILNVIIKIESNNDVDHQREIDIACYEVNINSGTSKCISISAAKRVIDLVKIDATKVFPKPIEAEGFDENSSRKQLVQFFDNNLNRVSGSLLGSCLFETIIGKENWTKIIGLGKNYIDIQLAWEYQDKLLARIPWEIMHDAENRRFLLRDFHNFVTITRLTKSQKKMDVKLEIPLKVLFVVGSDLNDPAIKAGSEYLGLLRFLETKNLTFNSRILLDADYSRVEQQIVSFKPSIIHFVGHGDINHNNEAYIKLNSECIYSAQLYDIINKIHSYYPMVVLNCCESVLFAQELVNIGIPYAIGMSGNISDSTCRMFTRIFYESLLENKPLHIAMAHARFVPSNDNVDWAKPALFCKENVNYIINQEEKEFLKKRLECAKKYTANWNPRSLCGRNNIIQAYHELIESNQTDVLLIRQNEPTYDQKLGMTMLLEAMLALTLRDGNIPCFIRFKEYESSKDRIHYSRHKIALRILDEMRETIKTFRLGEFNYSDREIMKLFRIIKNGNIQLSDEVLDLISRHPLPSSGNPDEIAVEILTTALKIDLLAMSDYFKDLSSSTQKIILLIDNVHFLPQPLFDEFLYNWIRDFSTAMNSIPIKIVMTICCKTDIKPTVSFYSNRSGPAVKELVIEPFRKPEHDITPYIQFLLSQEKPLIPAGDHATVIFELLYDVLKGYPSNFNGEAMNATLSVSTKLNCLKAAKDEQILKMIHNLNFPLSRTVFI